MNDNWPPSFTSAQLALPTERYSPEETPLSGVYFLLKDDVPVYIGQSKNVLSRVSAHKRSGVDFDCFTYVLCPRNKLDLMEAAYTALHRPKLNFHTDGYILGPTTGTHMEHILIDGKAAYEKRPRRPPEWAPKFYQEKMALLAA